MSRVWTPELKQQLRALFLEARLPIEKIAQALNRTPASVNNALSRSGIERCRCVVKCHPPDVMSPALARIHAHTCGDGHIFAVRQRDHYGYLRSYRIGYYRIRYGIAYTNTRAELREEYCRDVRNIFGLSPRYVPNKFACVVRSKAIWSTLKQLGAGRSREWRIPSAILNGSQEVRAAWLRALFDDEAHFDPQGRIRVRSVNRVGIEQAAAMLRRFVPCHVTPNAGLYRDGSCYLAVRSGHRGRFMRLIGSQKTA